jgi:hypothetical protein
VCACDVFSFRDYLLLVCTCGVFSFRDYLLLVCALLCV